ncbi:MAG: RDD family protein [Bacteroidetes bacterium]|nr:RDD family protein [Bacteroidota bacterium]
MRSLIESGSESGSMILLGYIIMIFNYIVYYTFCEKVFKGHTLGKLITGTRAIREDGEELTFKDAILRTLSRLVPFEPFTGFGTPWHDSWTKTRVVKTR